MKDFLRGFFSWLPALLCTVLLTALLLCWPASRLLVPATYDTAVREPAVLNEMQARIGAEVDTVAEELSFTAASAAKGLSRDALQAHAQAMSAWFAGLLHGSDAPAPQFDTAAIENAVREDALFAESHPASQLRTIARDQAGWKIEQIVERAVFPLRTNLISYAQKLLKNRESLQPWWPLVPWLPAMLAGAALLFFLPVALLQRRNRAGLRWFGACLIAAALLLAGLTALLHFKDIPGLLYNGNALFRLQLQAIASGLRIHFIIPAVIALLAGIGLMTRRATEMKR